MPHLFPYARPFAITLIAALCLSACGGGSNDGVSFPISGTPATTNPTAVVVAGPPKDLGCTDTAPVPDTAAIPPFVDNVATNQRGDARYATKETNAGVRVVAGFLDFWQPSTLLVDAGVTAAAQGRSGRPMWPAQSIDARSRFNDLPARLVRHSSAS